MIWDEDIWSELDVIADPAVRSVLRKFYRIMLEMYSAEQLAKAVAKEVQKDKTAAWTKWQKLGAFTVSCLITADTILHILVMGSV